MTTAVSGNGSGPVAANPNNKAEKYDIVMNVLNKGKIKPSLSQ
jgi:hypothetical protein